MLVITEADALQRALTNILSSTRQRREAERNGHLGIMVRQLDELMPRLMAAQNDQQHGNPEHTAKVARLITELRELKSQALTPA
jgi:hypothetical protein